ncbi:hypothetical protein V6C03_00545 [Methyloligella sp. 2.7D]|uniref:hypothetical protein n=1 Tax=unclassified Methyloligella TaxID=2625955 RepID=UPI00157DCF96|nr:hypothetical protein [Methyloligella sp. GL2]QKP76839.1 hypothetical protein HT051_04870 [Methyloligella sp. GL2]
MHRLSTSFILGYHGCDESVAERLLGGSAFRASENDYDWLGPGIYFWESNPRRALSFANEVSKRKGSDIRKPAVVGAVVDLGLCLDLASEAGIAQLKAAYKTFERLCEVGGVSMPTNSGGEDSLFRRLDCAVIQQFHNIRLESEEPAVDTVRGFFIEGEPIYPSAGFRDKAHCQICVCNPLQIKGVFRVSPSELK